ncbi:MAG TPA: phage major capsid protein, P2 family [Pedomonas sp.]|uniref:phage major capsid protein, P2 family n=1 Tax=Pedomonas sp. TaxID=2976421 RepID=UPI002F3E8F26
MKPTTRAKFNAYCSQIALLNTTDDVTVKFTVAPSVQQTLETKIQETSEFLKQINIISVDEQEGEKLGLIINGPVAGRTDTSGSGVRQTSDPSELEKHPYRCEKTNSDTHLSYAKLDAWAKFPDFQTRIRDALLKQQGLDRIMIGWNGTHVAPTTDKAANPLLQDVNKGWLQHIRDNAPTRVLSEGELEEGMIYVGDGVVGTEVDYASLDALVFDALELLDPWAKDDPELVVIVGSGLVHDKYFPIISQAGSTATEVAARDQILRSAKQLGGKPAVTVPFFPANAILITKLSNLSVYWQEGTRRRHVVEEPKRDRVENYESWNEAYVVEDYGFTALIENIVMGKKSAAQGG